MEAFKGREIKGMTMVSILCRESIMSPGIAVYIYPWKFPAKIRSITPLPLTKSKCLQTPGGKLVSGHGPPALLLPYRRTPQHVALLSTL